MRRTASTRGRLIQRVLTGAWRTVPPSLELQPDELEEIVPTLVDTWIPAGEAEEVVRRVLKKA